MALVLGLPKEEKVFISDIGHFKVIDIESETKFRIQISRYKHQPRVKFAMVTDQQSVEIFPEVRVSCGLKGKMEVARVVIEAPRSIKILRESMKEKKYV